MSGAMSSAIDTSRSQTSERREVTRSESLSPASSLSDSDPASRRRNGTANGSTTAVPNGNGHAQATSVPTAASRSLVQAEELDPDGRFSLSGIGIRAFGLGIGAGTGTTVAAALALQGSQLWRAPFFVAALALFHFLEFQITAEYNTPLATTEAFILTANGWAYNVAHVGAVVETLILHSGFFNNREGGSGLWSWLLKYTPAGRELPGSQIPALNAGIAFLADYGWLIVGFSLVLMGQIARSVAMATAGRSFNHLVQARRRQEHTLITTGIYAYLRHPSYFGFFWWAIGTQIVIGNRVCLGAYALVLWVFFGQRIRKEETYLISFFGRDYIEYRTRTVVGIPFLK